MCDEGKSVMRTVNVGINFSKWYYDQLCDDIDVPMKRGRNVVLSRELPSGRSSNTKSFCLCGHCKRIPHAPESYFFCCKEACDADGPDGSFTANFADKMKSNSLKCISLHPAFDHLILNADVLHVMSDHTEMFVRSPGPPKRNRDFRYMAYRHFNYWLHGDRVLGNRLEIPLCVFNKIIEKYPVVEDEVVSTHSGLLTLLGVDFFCDYRDEEESRAWDQRPKAEKIYHIPQVRRRVVMGYH